MTDLTDEEHDDIQKDLAVQHIRRGFVEPGDLEILGMTEAEVEEIWQQQARERAKPPVDPATGYDHEPAPGDYRAPDYPPEPNFGSFTTMNTPHGYEGWPLDNPADFADLVTEAADSLHFLFTFFPTYANQRSCLANTLILLNNIAAGIRATPARRHAESRHEIAPTHCNVHTACPACGGRRCRVYATEDQANAASDHAVIEREDAMLRGLAQYIADNLTRPDDRGPGVTVVYHDDKRPPRDADGIYAALTAGEVWICWMDEHVCATLRQLGMRPA